MDYEAEVRPHVLAFEVAVADLVEATLMAGDAREALKHARTGDEITKGYGQLSRAQTRHECARWGLESQCRRIAEICSIS